MMKYYEFRTNGTATSPEMTAWFFGKDFLADAIRKATKENKKTGSATYKTFKEGTGILSIIITKK